MGIVYHNPVLGNEVVHFLQPSSPGIYVDGTLGGGGHAELLLAASAPDGQVIGFDVDPDAIVFSKERLKKFGQRMNFVHSNFSNMRQELDKRGISGVAGLLLDLGVSSHQIDSAARGFSFQHDARLDMRMDPTSAIDACAVINSYDEKKLADIFWNFGEERFSRRIARCIARRRTVASIDTTGQLAAIVESAVGGRNAVKSVARIFQAIRIEVNRELESLSAVLQSTIGILGVGGRLVVLSYHSLEDRLVKTFMREAASTRIPSGTKLAPDTARTASLVVLTKKPVEAAETERMNNPRARSAKLRAAERIA